MIYTCFEMTRDCRADRAEGWAHFVSHYVPVMRKIVAHYRPGSEGDHLLERLLQPMRQPESGLFQSIDPAPERWFVAELRQQALAGLNALEPASAPELTIDLEQLSAALEPLTIVEKQVVWLETMRYAPPETGTLLRMEPRTVEKIRDKAAGLIRGKVDAWSRTLLADNGQQLAAAALAGRTADCLPQKAFLDVLDGRSTWRAREDLERHAIACWHCIDHFCRMVEVVEWLRGGQPLAEPEAAKFRVALGIRPPLKTGWKRWFASQG